MFKDKKILAIIPARGGSKGLPDKNLAVLHGKPLLVWTLESAFASRYIDRIVVSSNCDKIIQCAKDFGCEVPFKRPAELAQDTTPGMDPIFHALDLIHGYDFVLVLQVTSPLRRAVHIDECVEHCFEENSFACVSVTEAKKSPFWMYQLDSKQQMTPLMKAENFVRRQDLPSSYYLNGAMYFSQIAHLQQAQTFLTESTTAYIMSEEESVDIDTEFDLTVASCLLEKRADLYL